MSKIVKRTLDFLEVFAEHGRPLTLTELSKSLGVPVSSCHDVVQTLQERGYLYEISPRRGFYPTLKLQDVATRIVDNDPILARAEIALRGLRDKYDESVLLSRADGQIATYLIALEPSYPLRFLRRVGDTVRSLHAASVGKAILGTMDDKTRAKVVDKLDLVPVTEHTITDKAVLLAEVEQSMQRGWYISREESTPTAITISTTFQWLKSTFIITVAGPKFRIEAKQNDLIEDLLAAASDLSSPGTV